MTPTTPSDHETAGATAPILVAGGTGTTGRWVVRTLADSGRSAIVLTRDPSSAAARAVAELGRVEVVEADLGHPESYRDVLADVDRAYLATPPLADQLRLEAAFAATLADVGIEHLVKLSTTSTSMAPDSPIGYARVHWLVEKMLEELGLQWSSLRPTEFLENRLGLAPLVDQAGRFPSAQPDHATAMVSARDVGAAAATLLTLDRARLAPFTGRGLNISGPDDVSDTDIARIWSAHRSAPVELDAVEPAAIAQMAYGDNVDDDTVQAIETFVDDARAGKMTRDAYPTDPDLRTLHQPTISFADLLAIT